jgi:hypothetical protein
MIDVVQALELFEICADEMATEDADGAGSFGGVGGRRMTLTSRALAKRQLHVAHLARFPHRGALGDGYSDQAIMTLGAMIVFRTADRFGRAGASTTRTIEGLYRAVQRYVELLPDSLQDGVDKTAIGALIGETGQPLGIRRPLRSPTRLGCAGVARPAPSQPVVRREHVHGLTRVTYK